MTALQKAIGSLVPWILAGACLAAESAKTPSSPTRTPSVPPAVVAAGVRQTILNQYPPLFRKLGFTAAQQESFAQLEVERIAARDKASLEMARPDGADRDTLRASLQEIARRNTEDFYRRVAEVFGAEAEKVTRRYDDTLSLRLLAAKVQDSLSVMAMPIGDTAVDRLSEIIIANTTMGKDGRPLPEGKGIKVEVIVSSAGGVLSKPQVAVMRQILTVYVANGGRG